MKKAILTLVVLCGIGLMAGCKYGTTNEETTDITAVSTIVEEINQYDAKGRKMGYWEYKDESTGWFCKENYEEGMLDGPATYFLEDVMTIEMNYCKDIECGEMNILFEGTEGGKGIYLTDITKVDTTINGFLFRYRAHCKTNDVYEGIYSNEGTCYYEDLSGLLLNGFLGVGEWIVYDRDGKITKTIILDKPTADYNIK
jgi:hypothetical protein